MARKFPKFLYQHVTKAKSPGRFIMHLLPPAMLMQVVEEGKQVRIKALEIYDQSADEKNLREAMDRALRWYLMSQRQPDEVNPNGTTNMLPSGKPLEDAYMEMLEERGVYKKLHLAISTVSNMRRNIKEKGEYPGIGNMKRHLMMAGWTCMQEELWAKVLLK